MIELRRKDLNKAKLNELLKSRIDKLVAEYVSVCMKHQIVVSPETAKRFKDDLMNFTHISFTNDGRLRESHLTSSSLTIDDLIDNDVLDEEFGVYHISYDVSQDFYDSQHRLLGIYSTFGSVKCQIQNLIDGREECQVLDTDDLDIKFVPLDWMVDTLI